MACCRQLPVKCVSIVYRKETDGEECNHIDQLRLCSLRSAAIVYGAPLTPRTQSLEPSHSHQKVPNLLTFVLADHGGLEVES